MTDPSKPIITGSLINKNTSGVSPIEIEGKMYALVVDKSKGLNIFKINDNMDIIPHITTNIDNNDRKFIVKLNLINPNTLYPITDEFHLLNLALT